MHAQQFTEQSAGSRMYKASYHDSSKTWKQRNHRVISNLSASIFVNGITPWSSQESHFEKNKFYAHDACINSDKMRKIRGQCALSRIQLKLAKCRSRIAQTNSVDARHTFPVSDAENTRGARLLQIRTQSISWTLRAAQRVVIKTILRRLLIKGPSTYIVG